MEEEELLARARRGDLFAFGNLIERYQSAVFNLCYRMLGNTAEAEDAAQETFLRAYTQLHRYDPNRSFKGWLFSIASHHCIDRLRRRRVQWQDIDDEPLSNHPALREPRPGPEESAIRREACAEVHELLDRLAPRDRTVIVMRYWYDLSYEEIASSIGTTVSAVKSRLHRARQTLGAMAGPAELAPSRTEESAALAMDNGLLSHCFSPRSMCSSS
jgi:RNA polymerase sigma-70 factor (ECF subfamily)